MVLARLAYAPLLVIKDPKTEGYSPADKAKVETLSAMLTNEPAKLDFVAETALSVSVMPTPSGVKTAYTLDDAAMAAQVAQGLITERLTLPQGWSARQGQGMVEVLDATEGVQGGWVGGLVTDSAASPGLSSASMTLVAQEGTVARAQVVVDPTWLRDTARIFGIVVTDMTLKATPVGVDHRRSTQLRRDVFARGSPSPLGRRVSRLDQGLRREPLHLACRR